jgi:hypothetical protein
MPPHAEVLIGSERTIKMPNLTVWVMAQAVSRHHEFEPVGDI